MSRSRSVGQDEGRFVQGARLELFVLDNRVDLDDRTRRIGNIPRNQSAGESLEAVDEKVAYQSESAFWWWGWGIRVRVTFKSLCSVDEERHLDLALVGNHLLETLPAAYVSVNAPGSEVLTIVRFRIDVAA